MLNRKAFIGIVAVMCCAQAALGAASVRSVGTQNAGATSARTGSLRVTPTKTVSATPRTSVGTPAVISGAGRLATSGGGTIGNKPGKIGKQGSAASAAALADLERSMEELTNNYNALSNQYAQLSLGISDATATALNAKNASDANTEQIALKMNSTDFNTKFDARAETAGLADKSFVQSYVSENAPTPDLTGYYTSAQVESRLSSKVGVGSDFDNAFDSRLENKGIESNVSNLTNRVTAIEENPGVNTDAVNGLIDAKVEGLRTEVTMGLTTTLESAKEYTNANKGMTASEQAAFSTLSGNVTTLATQMDSKLSKDEASSTYSTKDELANAVIGGQVDLSGYATTGTVNALAERVTGAETAIQNNTAALNGKVDNETLTSLASQINAALDTKVDFNNFDTLSTQVSANSTSLTGKADAATVNAYIALINDELAEKVSESRVEELIDNANLGGGQVNLSNYYDKTQVNSLLDAKADAGTVYTKTEVNDLLGEKANAATVNSAIESINTSLGDKANTVTVNAALENIVSSLEGKASTEYVNDAIEQAVTGYSPEEIREIVEDIVGKSTFVTVDTFDTHVTNADSTFATKDENAAMLASAKAYADEKLDEISIPEPDLTNYYTKGQVDEFLNAKADTQTVNAALDAKANASAVYSIAEADETFVKQEDTVRLETQVGENTENIGTLGTTVGELQETVAGHGTDITNLQTDMATKANKSDLNALAESVNTNSSNIGSLNSNMTTLSDKVTGNTNNISSLQTTVGNMYDKDSVEKKLTATLEAAKDYANQLELGGGDVDPEQIQSMIDQSVAANSVSKTEFNTYKTNTASTISTLETANHASATYLSKTDAADQYLSKTDAADAYLTQANANTTYLNKDDAANTYLTQSGASTTYATKADLKTVSDVVGDSSDGLVKDVADLQTDVAKAATKSELQTAESTLTAAISTAQTAATDAAKGYTDGKISTLATKSELQELASNTYTKAETDAMLITNNICGGRAATVTTEQLEDGTGTRVTVTCPD